MLMRTLAAVFFTIGLTTAPATAAQYVQLPSAKASFVPVELAGHVGGLEPVLSVTIGAETKAYPLRILTLHGVINDTIAGTPVALSYCGPCGTVGAFKREPEMMLQAIFSRDDNVMLLMDRTRNARWSQKSGDGEAQAGKTPTMLAAVPSQVISMARVRQAAKGDQVVLVLQDTAVSRVPTPKTLALPGSVVGAANADDDNDVAASNQTKVLDARSWSLDLLSPERRLSGEERLILLENKSRGVSGPPRP